MPGSWIQSELGRIGNLGVALLCSSLIVSAQRAPRLNEVKVSPERIYLFGPRSLQRVNVTAVYSDGSEEDVTRQARISVAARDRVMISDGGLLHAINPGFTLLTARVGNRTGTARVLVLNYSGKAGVDFSRDVIPVLTMMGCNGSNCHGSLHGKAGFKLSQFGYEPQNDYNMIVHEAHGRRVDLRDPAKSLLLAKPTFQIAHGGGLRFPKDSQQYQVLLQWITEGARGPDQSAGSHIERLEVFPKVRTLTRPGSDQQLVVRAYYTDRSVEDVTRKVKYISLDEGILQVNKEGVVHGLKPGEATILIRAPGATAAARLGIRVPGDDSLGSFPADSNLIDRLVFEKLRRMNVQPSGLSTDAVFIRRAYLDTLGILPTPAEVSRFLDDKNPRKREQLIDRLLVRPEYADFWGLMWADLLTVNSFKSGASNPLQLDLWIREQFQRNVPFDQFARLLVAGSGPVRTEPGLGLAVARTPEEAAGFYTQLFLGVRMQCAQCHDHPFEKWRRSDFYGTAALFSQVAQKSTKLGPVIYDDPAKEFKSPITKAAVAPVIPGGIPVPHNGRPFRVIFAEWLTRPDNPYFAKAIVNRVWKHYLQVGLVEPVDDFRETNPPSNAALLDAMAAFFVQSGYDLKALSRLILNSTTYQLSSRPNKTNEFDHQLYSRYYYRRLPAEPLLDAITQVTESRHHFRFGYDGMRAVQLQDPAMYDSFLNAFDRNRRERVCEREENHTLLQTLEMISGDTVNEKIRNSPFVKRLAESGLSDRSVIEEVFLRAFSRKPEPEEVDTIQSLLSSEEPRRQKWEDVLWSALNSKEFIFNH